MINKTNPSPIQELRGNNHILQWHITHQCNLFCAHCYQKERASHMPDEMLRETLDKYCRFLEENHFSGRVYLTGGEPLLHPRFFDLAREITDRGLMLAVLTNGTLIDRMTANRLALLHPLFVQVSLDGVWEVHDRIRGDNKRIGGDARRNFDSLLPCERNDRLSGIRMVGHLLRSPCRADRKRPKLQHAQQLLPARRSRGQHNHAPAGRRKISPVHSTPR